MVLITTFLYMTTTVLYIRTTSQYIGTAFLCISTTFLYISTTFLFVSIIFLYISWTFIFIRSTFFYISITVQYISKHSCVSEQPIYTSAIPFIYQSNLPIRQCYFLIYHYYLPILHHSIKSILRSYSNKMLILVTKKIEFPWNSRHVLRKKLLFKIPMSMIECSPFHSRWLNRWNRFS